MNASRFQTFLLLTIVISLTAIAVRPYVAPLPAQAQASDAYPFFIEPSTYFLNTPDGSQHVLGKVVIDLRNGNVWGFPTLSPAPYPTSGMQTTPQTSHPFLLGKFAFSDINK